MGIINMKEDKLSKMEIVHIALITAFVLTEIIMSGIMIILMRRTKKIYLEIRNIEKQVEGYIEEVVAAEDDKMYQKKQKKDKKTKTKASVTERDRKIKLTFSVKYIE